MKKFTAAMRESLEFTQANPDTVLEVLLTYTKIDESATKKLAVPSYVSEINGPVNMPQLPDVF